MNFWQQHDLILSRLRSEAIRVRENFEVGHDIKDKDYHKKLNLAINRKVGKPVDILFKASIIKSMQEIC